MPPLAPQPQTRTLPCGCEPAGGIVRTPCRRMVALIAAVEAAVDAEPEVWCEVLAAYRAHLRGEG